MKKQDPNKRIEGTDGLTVGDFWSWAYSDLLSNVNRSTLAEFLVASALGLLDTPRIEWDAVDLHYQGHGIEVKAAAYLQSWLQAAPSVIRYDIAKKRGWDPHTNLYAPQPIRSADCYAFCLFPVTDLDSAYQRILETDVWEFYVLPTKQLELEFGDQKSVGLKAIQKVAPRIQYRDLKHQIDWAIAYR